MRIVKLSLLLYLHYLAHFTVANAVGNLLELHWSVEGLAAVNNTFYVDIGDTLVLICPNGSFSNVVSTKDKEQYDNCDSDVGSGTCRIRGNCEGSANHTKLYLSIMQTSAELPSTLYFEPGKTIYFASFSEGKNLLDAYSQNFKGGECLKKLKLTLHVREFATPSPTTQPTSASTAEPTSPTIATLTSTTEREVKITTSKGASPDKLVNGSRWHYAAPSLLCILVVSALTLSS